MHNAPQLQCAYCGHLDHYPSRMMRHTRRRHPGLTAKYARLETPQPPPPAADGSSAAAAAADDDVDLDGEFLFLFFSRPRSKRWPHSGRTFSIYPCPLSF